MFGFQLHILDIDIKTFLGELEQQKAKTLMNLTNIPNQKNNNILLPNQIKTIALITSRQSAAHIDFISQLKNKKSTKVYVFDTVVQGDKAKDEIINKIDTINYYRHQYDVIVLIRGGGTPIDLQAFNDLELAKAIANSKLPVMIGVGHTQDDVVINKVGYAFETPTSVVKKINYINFLYIKKKKRNIILIILILLIVLTTMFILHIK